MCVCIQWIHACTISIGVCMCVCMRVYMHGYVCGSAVKIVISEFRVDSLQSLL